MKQLEPRARERLIVILGLAVLFGISTALIAFERIQVSEEKIRQNQETGVNSLSQGSARGAKATDYRVYAKSAVQELASIIDRRKEGEETPAWESDNVRSALLSATVPALYQKLHFKLIQIATYLGRSDMESFILAQEQWRLLQDEYPWLTTE